MAMSTTVLAQLIQYERHNNLGPDLDPKFVRARMLGESLDDQGERPGWVLIAWLLEQGMLGQRWPVIESLANKRDEGECDEAVFAIGDSAAANGG